MMSDPNFQPPISNPFGLTDFANGVSPAFADIDGDGDLDGFFGRGDGYIVYFRNVTSPGAAVPQFNSAVVSPFGLPQVSSGSLVFPTLGDIDGDGDLDALVGDRDGTLSFFRNSASPGATAPRFETAITNPYGLTNVGVGAHPILTDIDGDGDVDLFVGNSKGDTLFFRNIAGSGANVPKFDTAIINPFGLRRVANGAYPTFGDLDGDGDLDALIGNGDGNTLFFRNSANLGATVPKFDPAISNAFGLTDFGPRPSLADIDGDGDLDAFVGNRALGFFLNAPGIFWSSLLDSQVRYFDPKTSVLLFDSDTISAASLTLIHSVNSTILRHGSKEVTFRTPLRSITTTNVTFSNGSLLIVGDNTIGIENDHAANKLIGASGNDLLFALGGNDTLVGNSGNDIINGGAGDDILTGGNGNDTYVVNVITDVITEGRSGGIDLVQSSSDYTLPDYVENLTFKDSSDLNAVGNAFDNVIVGNSGNNKLDGGAGNDSLMGGSGQDFLIGGAGEDTLVGGANDDTYYVDSVSDYVDERYSTGIDLVISWVGGSIPSHVEKLELMGSAPLKATGNYLQNVIIGNSGDNVISSGYDRFGDQFYGGSGNDSLVGSGGRDTLVGDDGNDTLTGYSDSDSLVGGPGNDLFISGYDSDVLVGGPGNDTYLLDERAGDAQADVLIEDSSPGIDLVQSPGDYTLPDNFEILRLTGWNELVGNGNSLSNDITGNYAANMLNGAGSSLGIGQKDSLSGGGGADIFILGSLNGRFYDDGDPTTAGLADYVAISDFSANSGNKLQLTGSVAEYFVGASPLSGINGQALFFDSDGNGTQSASDELIAIVNSSLPIDLLNDVNFIVLGSPGADSLIGSNGRDTLVGGAGDDTYVQIDGTDSIIEDPSGGIDVVQSSITYALADDLENLVLTGSSALNAMGNAGGNVITGNSAINVLDGGAGSDSLVGGSGDDSLIGGAGRDTLVGGDGSDTYRVDVSKEVVIEEAVVGIDLVVSAADYTLSANVENLNLVSRAALNGTGNSLSNVILGNLASNTLNGVGAGSGSNQTDSLTGGAGADIFVLGTATTRLYDDADPTTAGTSDYVCVSDFSVSSADKLQLKGSAVQYFVGASPLAGIDGQAIFFDSDNSGSKSANDELMAIVTCPVAVDLSRDATFIP